MFNYIKLLPDGTQEATRYEPQFCSYNGQGDYFDLESSKWYTDDTKTNELNPQPTYLPYRIHVDTDGSVSRVEKYDMPTMFEDYIQADKVKGEHLGKNACTAWVNFDGTTTPPTIRDSYNVSAVIRVGTGSYDIYFEKPMDKTDYMVAGSVQVNNVKGGLGGISTNQYFHDSLVRVNVSSYWSDNSYVNTPYVNVQVLGGRD